MSFYLAGTPNFFSASSTVLVNIFAFSPLKRIQNPKVDLK
jgi:hypothetical protein